MLKKRKRRIPKKWIYTQNVYRTRAIQHPKTAKFMGRKKVRGRGDSTAILRLKETYGKTRGGTFRGRIAVRKYKKRSKKGKKHIVKRHRRKTRR